MTGAGAPPLSPKLPEQQRVEVVATVSAVVKRGREAIAHVETELARVEHKVVDARTKLDDLRRTMDELELATDRLRGADRG